VVNVKTPTQHFTKYLCETVHIQVFTFEFENMARKLITTIVYRFFFHKTCSH